MAADFMHDPVAAGTATGLGVAVLAWLGNRMLGKAAIQAAINASFHEIMDQLRVELRVALQERDKERGKNLVLQVKIEELQRTIAALELRLVAATPRSRA